MFFSTNGELRTDSVNFDLILAINLVGEIKIDFFRQTPYAKKFGGIDSWWKIQSAKLLKQLVT